MDLDAMTTEEKLTIGGSVLAAIGTFLLWLTASILGSTVTIRGIDGDGQYVLILAAIAGGIVLIRNWSRSDQIGVLICGLLMVLITGMYILDPATGIDGNGEGTEMARQIISPAIGLYLSALGSLGTLIGGWRGYSSTDKSHSKPSPVDQ